MTAGQRSRFGNYFFGLMFYSLSADTIIEIIIKSCMEAI